MREFKIKIVPNDKPNADGEWLNITESYRADLQREPKSSGRQSSWTNTEAVLRRYVPPGFHIVAADFTP